MTLRHFSEKQLNGNILSTKTKNSYQRAYKVSSPKNYQKTYHLSKNAMRTKLCNQLDLNMLLSILLAIKSSYVYEKIWSKSNLSIIIQVQNKLTTNSGYKLFVFHIQTLEDWALTYA